MITMTAWSKVISLSLYKGVSIMGSISIVGRDVTLVWIKTVIAAKELIRRMVYMEAVLLLRDTIILVNIR